MMKLKKLFIGLAKFNYLQLIGELAFFARFFLLVIFYLFFAVLRFFARMPILRFLAKPFLPFGRFIYYKIITPLNQSQDGEISSLDLVYLAVRHLQVKKTRTLITVGGMSIGFGLVVFLLSLGYGVQKLVISRVARLDEMRQINVSIGQSSSLVVNDTALDDFKKINNVELVIPMVSVVSKVNYNNSVSDVVAYGVNRQFLEQSAIKPVKGEIFEDYELTEEVEQSSEFGENKITGQVAGASNQRLIGAKLGKELSQVKYSIHPLVWKPVYTEPSTQSKILGYTKRGVGEIEATEVWGQSYEAKENLIEGLDLFGNSFNPWIFDTLPLWKKEVCGELIIDCVDGQYQPIKNGGQQTLVRAYITESDTSINRYKFVAASIPTFIDGDVVESVDFNFKKGAYTQLYEDVFEDKKISGMSSSWINDLLINGELVYGEAYSGNWGNIGVNDNGRSVGYWIRARVPLWREVDCFKCQDLFLSEVDNNGLQKETIAYFKADQVLIEGLVEPPIFGQVLGESTASADLSDGAALLLQDENEDEDDSSSPSGQIALTDGSILIATQLDDGNLSWTSMGDGSASASLNKRDSIPLPDSAQKLALVNRAMLKVLGIDENAAIGQQFSTTFMLDQEFFSRADYQAESLPADFTIVGVIPDDKTPAYYLHFNDLKSLGIENYSQAKIVVKSQDDVKQVRQDIEASGFRTSSVVDTVGKINELFNTVRFVLSILGMVALSVAALGMFNTLTVSLLEKTREVGLMKAIGMKSNEVKRLFLAESVVMGLSGGICGLLLSYLAGQLMSFILSTISVTKGLGYIQLVYIPFYLGAGVVALSFIIAVATGMYPSYRATKISALNALRYE